MVRDVLVDSAYVLPQVMVQDVVYPAFRQELAVFGVKIMCNVDLANAAGFVECTKDCAVATSRGIDCAYIRVLLEGLMRQFARHLVTAKSFGYFYDVNIPVTREERRSKAFDPLVFAAKPYR